MRADSEDQGADGQSLYTPFQGKSSFHEYSQQCYNCPTWKKGVGEKIGGRSWQIMSKTGKTWRRRCSPLSQSTSWSPAEGCVSSILMAASPPGASTVPSISWPFCGTHSHSIWGASPRILKIFSLRLAGASEKCRICRLGDEGVQWH